MNNRQKRKSRLSKRITSINHVTLQKCYSQIVVATKVLSFVVGQIKTNVSGGHDDYAQQRILLSLLYNDATQRCLQPNICCVCALCSLSFSYYSSPYTDYGNWTRTPMTSKRYGTLSLIRKSRLMLRNGIIRMHKNPSMAMDL